MIKMLIATLFTGLLLAAAGVSAGEGVPGRPEAVGTLNAIDLAAHTMVLDGKTYVISDSASWMGLGPAESPGTIASKLLDHRLGFRAEQVGPDKAVITEIWVHQ